MHAIHESMALEALDFIQHSDYYFETLCYNSSKFRVTCSGKYKLNFIPRGISYECLKTKCQHVCTYLAFYSLIMFQTSWLLIINDLNRLLKSVLILTVAYR